MTVLFCILSWKEGEILTQFSELKHTEFKTQVIFHQDFIKLKTLFFEK